MAETTSLYDPEAMLSEARRQRAQVVSLVGNLDDRAFTQRPDGGRWSVGECLEHLALMNAVYLDAVEVVSASAREAGLTAESGQRGKRHGWLGDAFVRSLEPPPGRMKGKAFKQTVPQQRPKTEVVGQFLEAQDRLIASLDASRTLDLARVRMRSPLFRAVRLTLGQAYGAMLAHNRRHIWQAEGVLALLRTNPQGHS